MNIALVLLIASVMTIAAAKTRTAVEAARFYATAHHEKLTITRHGGYFFVEMEGSDIFGTGKTEELAAEDFLGCADLFDHEPADPGHAPAMFVGPYKDYCI
jgi:hypothetical protein